MTTSNRNEPLKKQITALPVALSQLGHKTFSICRGEPFSFSETSKMKYNRQQSKMQLLMGG